MRMNDFTVQELFILIHNLLYTVHLRYYSMNKYPEDRLRSAGPVSLL